MTRLSSLLVLSAAALALSSPALAKGATVLQGESLCKAEVQKQQAPKSVRIDKDATRATTVALIYTLRIKGADDATSKVRCTVDRDSRAVVLSAGE